MAVRFTERELDLMRVLWRLGPATVAEVREALDDEPAYNTVLTMLGVLEEKGHVTRDTKKRAHRYTAVTSREAAGVSALDRVTRSFFRGSAEELLLRLVESRPVDEDELRRLRRLLDERLEDLEGES